MLTRIVGEINILVLQNANNIQPLQSAWVGWDRYDDAPLPEFTTSTLSGSSLEYPDKLCGFVVEGKHGSPAVTRLVKFRNKGETIRHFVVNQALAVDCTTEGFAGISLATTKSTRLIPPVILDRNGPIGLEAELEAHAGFLGLKANVNPPALRVVQNGLTDRV